MITLDDADVASRAARCRVPVALRSSLRHVSRRLRGVAVFGIGFAVASGLVALPVAPPVAALGTMPACRLADIATVPHDYDSWSTTLVDWLLAVPSAYVPPDLVPTSRAGLAGGGSIRAVAIDDLRAMTLAAARNGTPISVISAYRSYREQVASFNGWVAKDSYANAITYSQRPGHSDHQLGLAIDFKAAAEATSLSYPDWARTPTGAWMTANAWRYGWVPTYPLGKGGALFNTRTCFHYEPWHYRYLGRELAAKVHASGLTIREYLWAHYTRVEPKTGRPIPAATPTPGATPTMPATPSPTASPSDAASPTSTARATDGASTSAAAAAGRGSDGGPAGSWFGIDPPVILGGLLVLLLASIGIAARRTLISSSP